MKSSSVIARWVVIAGGLLAISGTSFAEEGDLLHRDRLTGDWGGLRSDLVEKGYTFQADLTGFLEGIGYSDVSGGVNGGGHLFASMNYDGTRAKSIEGFSLDIGVEGHYGQTVNDRTGTIMPPNFSMNAIEAGESVWGVTEFKVTQQLGQGVSVYGGKFVPLYGYRNEFMDGLGRTKFNNTALVAKPVVGGAIAYSAWMAGINWNVIPSAGPRDRGTWLKFYVQNTNMTAQEVGLDSVFEDGVNLFGEVDFPTRFFDLPGNHVLSLVWSNRERTSYDIHHAITLPDGGVAPGSKDSTWNVWYSMDQYLHVDPDDPARGWGLFGKVEFSGGDPNSLDIVANAGFGGAGPTACRRLDRWGIGVYFLDVSDALKETLVDVEDLELDREWGVEAFYSVALTPAVALSFDGQMLRSAVSDDWQSVLGLRLNISL